MTGWTIPCRRALAALAVLAGTVRAVDVVIHNLDVRTATVGAAITIPVDIHGLDRATFAAFQLEFDVDPAAFDLQSVERGALIAAQDAGLAFSAHAPYLWALESSRDGSVLRVAGLILLDGLHAQQGNLNALNRARVPAEQGELLRLNLILRTLNPTPITLLSAGTNLLVNDACTAQPPAAAAPAGAMPGGTAVTDDLPNAWAYRYFGLAGSTPLADPDGDRLDNAAERVAGTSPVVPDVRLSLSPGWNLFALPVEPLETRPEAVLSSACRAVAPDAAPGTPVYLGAVWGWVITPHGGRFAKAQTLLPLHGYWVYVPAAVDLVIPGRLPADRVLPVSQGWNLLGAVGDLPLRSRPGATSPVAWSWNPAAGYGAEVALRRSLAAWVYCPQAGVLDLDPGPVAP